MSSWQTGGQTLEFGTISHTLDLLHREGFLELMDYGSVLDRNGGLLQRMTDNDLRSIDQWMESLRDSLQTWETFRNRIPGKLAGADPDEQTYAIHVLNNTLGTVRIFAREYDDLKSDDSYRERMSETLRSYLRYVNANLILSKEFEAGLHDWEDYLPFYRQKFLAVGQESLGTVAQAEASHQLFDIAFPELAIQTPEHLLRILEHKRVSELRALIDEAARGDTVFDEKFARSVFREIIGAERKAARERRVLGYLTVPIGFIPLVGNFAQLLLEEAVGTILERKLTKKYRWFYMLSDVAYKNG